MKISNALSVYLAAKSKSKAYFIYPFSIKIAAIFLSTSASVSSLTSIKIFSLKIFFYNQKKKKKISNLL